MGEVQGETCAGGIVNGTATQESSNEISNCFNVGKVSVKGETFKTIGGIVGTVSYGPITINNCYNIAVLSLDDATHNSNKIGGIVGRWR